MNQLLTNAADAAQDVDAREVARLRDTRRPIRLGLWVLVVGLGLFLAWAAWAPLEEGVPAPATVAVQGRRTTIQHASGGVVKAVKVRDGEQVAAGALLIELDDAQTRAVYEATRQNYLAQRALEARLTAELAGAAEIRFDPDLLQAPEPQAAQHMAVQKRLFEARRAAQTAALAAQEQAIAGLQSQLDGMGQMLQSRQTQQQLQADQLQAVQRLADDGFAPRNQALQLAQAQADLHTTISGLQAEQQRLRSAQAEARLRRDLTRQEIVKEVSAQMADLRRELQANQERMVAAQLELTRMEIRAPIAGQVLGLAVHNPGGVVEPSRPLMDILPVGQPLVLQVKLPPHLIDTVHAGQELEVRFSAFAASPHLVVMGKLVSVSGDVLLEQTPHGPTSYYPAQAELTTEGMRALEGRTVQPGMAAEVLVRTGERSLLDYLLGPLLRRVSTSLTER